MKQLAAILLLGIFSFNLFGYRLVASFLEKQENIKMELALDENNYEDHQLISIKQPTNLPYYQNSKTFQRIDGEIEIEGVYYKYVKCRIYNDSLEMLCIPTNKWKIVFHCRCSNYRISSSHPECQGILLNIYQSSVPDIFG